MTYLSLKIEANSKNMATPIEDCYFLAHGQYTSKVPLNNYTAYDFLNNILKLCENPGIKTHTINIYIHIVCKWNNHAIRLDVDHSDTSLRDFSSYVKILEGIAYVAKHSSCKKEHIKLLIKTACKANNLPYPR